MQFDLRSAGLSLALISLVACSPPQASTPAQEICSTCGVVQSISPVTTEGGTTGAGAVIGAVVGGVAGNQVGGGSGNTVATAAGVIGGALLGNNIEQNRNTSTVFDIVIRMQDGSQRSVTVPDPGSISPGAAVNVSGNTISLR